MKLLIHVCCAPCLIGTKLTIDRWAEKENIDIDMVCYWYNPNIHPYTEYKSRLDALENYALKNNITLIIQNKYGLVEFSKNVIDDLQNRCGYCYSSRIEKAAKYAADNNFDAFTSSLLVSPYQKHELLRETGEKYAVEYNTQFFYCDARVNFREGQKIARETGVYMQKYCGCIFSEEERYIKPK